MKSRLFLLLLVLFAPFSSSWAMGTSAPQPEAATDTETAAQAPVKKLTEEELIARAKKLREEAERNKIDRSPLEQLIENILLAASATGLYFGSGYDGKAENIRPIVTSSQRKSSVTRAMDVATQVAALTAESLRNKRTQPGDHANSPTPPEWTADVVVTPKHPRLTTCCYLLIAGIIARMGYKWYTTNYANNIAAAATDYGELLQILKNPNASKELPQDLKNACNILKKTLFNQRIDQLTANGMDYETARQTALDEEKELAGG